MIRVLITGCSMHSYDLIRALKDNYDGEEIYVVGINCDDTALLRKGVDAGYVVPRITEESYIPTVIDICEKEIAQLTNVLGVVLNKCRYADDSIGYDYGSYQ